MPRNHGGLFRIPSDAQAAALGVLERSQDDNGPTNQAFRDAGQLVVNACRKYEWVQREADRLTELGRDALAVARGELGREVRGVDLTDSILPFHRKGSPYLDEAHEVLTEVGWRRLTRIEWATGHAILSYATGADRGSGDAERKFSINWARKINIRKMAVPTTGS